MNLQDAIRKIDRGIMSEDAAAGLRDWALEDPNALERIAAMSGGGSEAYSEPGESFKIPPRSSYRMMRLGAIGILVLGVLGVCGYALLPGKFASGASRVPFVTVYDSSDAGNFKVGQAVLPGRYVLHPDERVAMVFKFGAKVELKGPGAFEILGERRMGMNEGLLRARIDDHLEPFEVDTPEGRVVNLGNAFTVARTHQGSTEVHVDEGSVRFEAGGKNLTLHENEAASAGAGKMNAEDYLKHRFDTPLDLHQIANAMRGAGQSARPPWRATWNLADCKAGEAPPLQSGSFKLRGGVVAEGLNYASGGYALKTSPNAILAGSTPQDFECSVELDTAQFPGNESIYVSFLMRLPDPVAGVEVAYAGLSFQSQNRWESFFVGDGWYKEGLCMHEENPNAARSRNQEIPLGIPLSKETVLLVLRLDPLRKVTDIWINPPLGLTERPAGADARWQNMPEFEMLGLRSGRWFHQGGYSCIFDELRLGADWSSVLPLDDSK